MVMGVSSSLASGFLFFYFSVAPPFSPPPVSPSPLRSLACSYTHSRADQGYFMAASLRVHGSTRPARLQEIRNIQGSFFLFFIVLVHGLLQLAALARLNRRVFSLACPFNGTRRLARLDVASPVGESLCSALVAEGTEVARIAPPRRNSHPPHLSRGCLFLFFCKREIITFFFLPSSPCMLCLFFFLFFVFFSSPCVRTLGIVSVPAYVIHYIIIYRILITDSVGAGAKAAETKKHIEHFDHGD